MQGKEYLCKEKTNTTYYNICSLFKQDYPTLQTGLDLIILCFYTFLFLAAFDAAVGPEVEVKFA